VYAAPIVSRLQEPTFLILTALAERQLHGYALLRRVEELSDGRLRLRAGTLYAALDRLVGEGLVAVDGEEVVEGRLRRYYILSEAGHHALALETHRWQANVAAASRVLATRPAEGLAARPAEGLTARPAEGLA
jgi:DNA-binding PadR family transcriptional regulator